DLRDMPCEDEIARPDRPSARSWSTSFALIFRIIPDCSFRRVPYTHGGRSVDRAAPNDIIGGLERRHRYGSDVAPEPPISGPQRGEYSTSQSKSPTAAPKTSETCSTSPRPRRDVDSPSGSSTRCPAVRSPRSRG